MTVAILDARNEVTNPGGWRAMAQIVGIAYHHTVTTIAPDATEAQERAHIRAIDAYHVGQDYGGFGYHAIAFPSGRAYLCGDLTGARAHVAKRNHELLGVALVGDFTGTLPGEAQIRAAAACIRLFLDHIGYDVPVRGHREWAVPGWETSCPGRVTEVVDRLVAAATGEDDMQLTDTFDPGLGAPAESLESLFRKLFWHIAVSRPPVHLVQGDGKGAVWVTDGLTRWPLPSPEAHAVLRDAGVLPGLDQVRIIPQAVLDLIPTVPPPVPAQTAVPPHQHTVQGTAS